MTDPTPPPEMTGIRIEGKLYTVPDSLTLGELRTVKNAYGVNLAAGENLPLNDPDVMAAMVWVLLHREDKSVTVEQVDDLDIQTITTDVQEDQVDAVPPPVPVAASPPNDDVAERPAPSLEMIHAASGSRAS